MYFYVYIINSKSNPKRYYVGRTVNLKKRLIKPNSGKVRYTKAYKPWCINTVIAFRNRSKSFLFEKYLKSHSGRAFAKKHFLNHLRKVKTKLNKLKYNFEDVIITELPSAFRTFQTIGKTGM
jgi:putative endonuclease